MIVPVMQVGEMSMPMGHRLVLMLVRVRLLALPR